MLRITAYADRLERDLDGAGLAGVGQADAAELDRAERRGGGDDFEDRPGSEETLDGSFTTRPDTLFGATYMVLAPEHPLVERARRRIRSAAAVAAVRARRLRAQERIWTRTAEAKEKTGVFTGAYAINPVERGERIPIWVADYVLMGYGTGAIMAVPAQR